MGEGQNLLSAKSAAMRALRRLKRYSFGNRYALTLVARCIDPVEPGDDADVVVTADDLQEVIDAVRRRLEAEGGERRAAPAVVSVEDFTRDAATVVGRAQAGEVIVVGDPAKPMLVISAPRAR